MNQDITIAQKYAQAFLNIFPQALDSSTLEKAESLVTFLNTRQRVLFYLQLVFIPQETIKKTLKTILGQYSLEHPWNNLIDLLIEDKRIYLLTSVLESVISLYKQRNNIMDFTIESSHELSAQELKELKNFLEKKTGKKISYTTKLNKKLIAGIKMYSDTLYWEHSVRKQLNGLSTLKN